MSEHARKTAGRRAAPIPTYELYGETQGGLPPERMHCESIAERSRLYDWEIGPHRHESFFQILYIETGSGEAFLEDMRVSISAPCLIVVPSRCVHGFTFSRDIRGVVVTLVDKHLDTVLADAPDLSGRFTVPEMISLNAADAALAGQLFAAVSREFNANSPWRLAAIRACLSLALIKA